MPSSSTLSERLTAQARTETTVRGETTRSYRDLGTVWAGVEEQTGRDAVRALQQDARRVVLVTVRRQALRQPAARFVRADGSALDAQGRPKPIQRGYLEYACVEVAD